MEGSSLNNRQCVAGRAQQAIMTLTPGSTCLLASILNDGRFDAKFSEARHGRCMADLGAGWDHCIVYSDGIWSVGPGRDHPECGATCFFI